jgi:hypothetical protein
VASAVAVGVTLGVAGTGAGVLVAVLVSLGVGDGGGVVRVAVAVGVLEVPELGVGGAVSVAVGVPDARTVGVADIEEGVAERVGRGDTRADGESSHALSTSAISHQDRRSGWPQMNANKR